jgi:hypothetical protein
MLGQSLMGGARQLYGMRPEEEDPLTRQLKEAQLRKLTTGEEERQRKAALDAEAAEKKAALEGLGSKLIGGFQEDVGSARRFAESGAEGPPTEVGAALTGEGGRLSTLFKRKLVETDPGVAATAPIQQYQKTLEAVEPEEMTPYQEVQAGLGERRFAQEQKEFDWKQQMDKQNLALRKQDLALKKAVADAKKDKETKYSGSQYLSAAYALRMKQAEDVVDEIITAGFNPAEFKNYLVNKDAFNAIKDPNQRRYAQAMRNFVNAALRRESGAAIAESEFDSANKQYFAQLGDDPQTLLQKKRNRLATRSGMETEAGGAYDNIIERYQGYIAPGAGGGGSVPRFATEAEAEASGHKGEAVIAGRRAVIE